MNIGFDLDRIFINTPPGVPNSVIEKFYKKRDNGILLYRIPSPAEQLLRKATHYSLFRPPIKENLEFLSKLSKIDNKLYLISSRFKFLENITEKLVKKHQLNKIFDQMYFNYENKQPHIFKDEIIKKLHLDAYIDDDLSLIKYVANNNQKTKFFWLNQNRDKKTISENIFAISRLTDIFS